MGGPFNYKNHNQNLKLKQERFKRKNLRSKIAEKMVFLQLQRKVEGRAAFGASLSNAVLGQISSTMLRLQT